MLLSLRRTTLTVALLVAVLSLCAAGSYAAPINATEYNIIVNWIAYAQFFAHRFNFAHRRPAEVCSFVASSAGSRTGAFYFSLRNYNFLVLNTMSMSFRMSVLGISPVCILGRFCAFVLWAGDAYLGEPTPNFTRQRSFHNVPIAFFRIRATSETALRKAPNVQILFRVDPI